MRKNNLRLKSFSALVQFVHQWFHTRTNSHKHTKHTDSVEFVQGQELTLLAHQPKFWGSPSLVTDSLWGPGGFCMRPRVYQPLTELIFDVSQSHNRRLKQLKWMMPELLSAASVIRAHADSLSWLCGIIEQNRAILIVSSDLGDFAQC